MKSLKRTLSLVLALVMVLGLFGGLSINAAASDFSDDADIQYNEAVDVMSEIGAIEGYGSSGANAFKPKQTITRAEAAALVTRTVYGAENAKGLTDVTSSFSDVPASKYKWAIPSIEYLVERKVINGVGGGKFNPEGEVTGYEVAKMLLCALGYGAKGEYTGNGWDFRVALDAQQKGIFDSRADGAKPLGSAATREEIALYCFNALQKQMVQYLDSLNKYFGLTVSGTIADNIPLTMMKQVYPYLDKKDAIVESGTDIGQVGYTDALGNPARLWTYKGAEIGEYPIKPARTYITKQTDVNALANDLKGLKTTAGAAGTSVGVYITRNGRTTGVNTTMTSAQLAQKIIDDGLTNNGTVVKVYANPAGNVVAITSVQTDLATVGAVNPATKEIRLTVCSDNALGGVKYYTVAETDDLYPAVSAFKEDDRILIVPVDIATGYDPANYILGAVAEPTMVTGQVSETTAKYTYTVADKTYAMSYAHTAAATMWTITSPTTTYNVWLDTNGFIVDVEAVDPEDTSDVVYALEVFQKVSEHENVVNYVKVVRSNGKLDSLPIASTQAGLNLKVPYMAELVASKGVYKMTALAVKNADTDTIGATAEMTTMTNADVEAVAIKLKISGIIAKDDKQLSGDEQNKEGSYYYENYYSPSAKLICIPKDGEPTVYGLGNAVTISGDTSVFSYAIVEKTKDGKYPVTTVFLWDTTPAGTVDATKTAYYHGTKLTETLMTAKNGQKVMVPTYKMWLNGVETSVPVSSGTPTTNTYYRLASDPNIEGAYVVGAAFTTDTGYFTAVKNQTVTKTNVKTGTLLNLNSNNAGTSNADNISFENAKVIDTRTEQAKKDKYVEISSAAKALAALSEYTSLDIAYTYDVTTKNATVLYINDVGAKIIKTSIKFQESSSATAAAVTNGGTFTMPQSKDVYTVTASANEGGKLTVMITLTTKSSMAGASGGASGTKYLTTSGLSVAATDGTNPLTFNTVTPGGAASGSSATAISVARNTAAINTTKVTLEVDPVGITADKEITITIVANENTPDEN